MEEQQIKVRITTGNSGVIDTHLEYDIHDLKSIDKETRLKVMKSIIKVEISTVLQPIVTGTGIDIYHITDAIVYNLGLDVSSTFTKSNIYNIMLMNELMRLANQCTVITGIDNKSHIERNRKIIADIAQKIVDIMG